MKEPTAFAPDRRAFLGQVGAGAIALAGAGLYADVALGQQTRQGGAGQSATAQPPTTPPAGGGPMNAAQLSDRWLEGIKGVHKQIFDATTINDGYALAYAMNFLDTNKAAYSLPDSQLTAIVGLRHFSIPIAFNNTIWAKYKLGAFFKVNDPKTQMPSVRNLWNQPAQNELPFAGMAYDRLQGRGVIFTICNVALTLVSGAAAEAAKLPKDAAKAEWMANMLPGSFVVPSGVLAVNRAQEKGCTYCYAG